ncbi:YqgE/AlgH family protein [Emcibacter sp.]|uniref:YqgE/AlgH family protein n=1 Tax=Emcibacter sp. TaxID=1979954 RepID=UPI002AA95230|nr:YqgE/AlgH family protein [Emcibacter sp.]
MKKQGYLEGQLLLAMPGMADPRFDHSVIYVCSHNEEGAMGLIINKRTTSIDFPSLLDQLDIDVESSFSSNEAHLSDPILLHAGGPVEIGRGFILHSADYVQDSTMIISETIALTATVDILSAIARGEGPQDYIVALGYSGWGAGQLEQELQQNSWLNIEADEELVFRTDLELKWPRAMAKLGVDVSLLSMDSGHA